MKLKLIRSYFGKDGIFGELRDSNGKLIMYSCERAYNSLGVYSPKLKAGVYNCVKGPHRLAGMKNSFATFEIKGVKGHTGILFHVGNYNKDSSGCVLLGMGMGVSATKEKMLTMSTVAFNAFMGMLSGVDSFELEVMDA